MIVVSFIEVDAVSGAAVDAQLANPLPYGFHVPSMTKDKAV
ncbi:MAG: hypothetical protein AWT59_3513 [Candidatus Gallionella acididurans]|uniref:Uncharacterized protein n=1 Tax=Candidatus Gallionella acididurans TaxID=1796491 RepID=A0A139BNH2_9PROT|nr:MAG: hypothetical protein AWT59_3513 [Candidatus Gallionella acididurans]